MSRLKKLQERRKNRKIKNILKATSYFLALTLFVGSAQSLGTYALFIDTEDVPSSIQLSTGDVDIEINKGTELTDIAPNDKKALPVKIVNNGTLRQNIKLDLSIADEIKNYIDYEFDLSNGVTVNEENGVLYKDGKLFSLEPDGCVTGSVNITLKDINKNIQNELAKKTHSIDLKVKSTQISKNDEEIFNDGFYDEVIQKNTVTVVEGQVITIATGKNAHYTGKHGSFFSDLYIPVNINSAGLEGKEIKLSATAKEANSSKTYNATYYKGDKGFDYILIRDTESGIKFKGIANITIKVTIKDSSSNKIDEYELKCNVYLDNAGNSCKGNAPDHPNSTDTHCHSSVVNAGHKSSNTLEERPIIQDIESSNKPEVVLPPKEDIEAPNKPEIVLPPKEDIEVPNKPEVVEPSKEDIEVPNKSEVVQPPIEN